MLRTISDDAVSQNSNMGPDLVLVGPITKDLAHRSSGEYSLGGTVTFGAVAALSVGKTVGVVATVGPEVDLSLFDNTDFHRVDSLTTTTYINDYDQELRVQRCLSKAETITPEDVPLRLRKPKAVLLGPLTNEVASEVAQIFDEATIVAALPQGWMRSVGAQGLVTPKPWTNQPRIVEHLDVVIVSDDDIGGDIEQVRPAIEANATVVVTRGAEGCTIFTSGDTPTRANRKLQTAAGKAIPNIGRHDYREIPGRRVKNEVDPTGAGDVFASAFVTSLSDGTHPFEAAYYANVAASFSIEGIRFSTIPTNEVVTQYVADFPLGSL